MTKIRIFISFIILFSLSAGCGGGGGSLVDLSPVDARVFSCSRVDFDEDGNVNMFDINNMEYSLCSTEGDEEYNSSYDVNSDGIVNFLDVDFIVCCMGMPVDKSFPYAICPGGYSDENGSGCDG